MKVSVYDTYVTDQSGTLMHFDVIVPSDTSIEKVLSFGQDYLKKKGRQVKSLSANECRFCHMEHASPQMQNAIKAEGYFIYEMEGCR